jgi:hypothetical protein
MSDDSNQVVAINAIVSIVLKNQYLFVFGARVNRVDILADPYRLALSLWKLLYKIFTSLIEGGHINVS